LFAQFIFQFSALSLCFFQWGERKQKEKKDFPAGKLAAVPDSAHARTSLAVMCNKKLF
jgi:hypothetical protein